LPTAAPGARHRVPRPFRQQSRRLGGPLLEHGQPIAAPAQPPAPQHALDRARGETEVALVSELRGPPATPPRRPRQSDGQHQALLKFYNEQRPHQGYRLLGHMPADLFWGAAAVAS
jgi:hypothetical protein